MEDIKRTKREEIIKKERHKNEEALIQDLSPELKEITEGKVEWIYRYCDKSKIGRAILSDFLYYNKYTSVNGGIDNGGKISDADIKYIFSHAVQYEGILSNAQAFQALAALITDFEIEDESAQAILLSVFERILNTVNPERNTYVFDTTPYLHKSQSFRDGEHAYIDTVTWVLSAMLSFFRLYIEGAVEADEALIDRSSKVYRKCVDYLISSYIEVESGKRKFTSGWNFTKGCDTPSLYFTFAVSETLIDILNSFPNVIRVADISLIAREIDKRLGGKDSEEALEDKKMQAEATYAEQLEKYNDGSEESKREREIFARLNEYAVYDEKSPYAKLEELVKRAANNIWSIVKDNISDSFYSSDLASIMSEATIEQSFSNDALFNSIFIINTVINAGLDEDAEDLVNYFTVTGSEDYDRAIADYDAIRNSLLMSYDNTWQFYTKLKKVGKDYKVSEFSPAFDEAFKNPTISNIAIELRKARMSVFSIMPLLVKTKTTIGEFVIAYPQYDMQIYLEEILKNRYVSDRKGRALWVWEKDRYSTSSNYYFITALADFFSYYEKYEMRLIENAADFEAQAKKHRKAGEKAKELELGKIIKEKDAEIEALQRKYDALVEETKDFREDPLKQGMWMYLRKTIQEKVAELFTAETVGAVLSGLSEQIAGEAIERVARKSQSVANVASDAFWYEREDPAPTEESRRVKALEDGIAAFEKSLISERSAEVYYGEELKKKPADRSKNPTDDINRRVEYLHRDIKNSLRYYAKPVVTRPEFDPTSDYVRSEGYKGIIDALKYYANLKK